MAGTTLASISGHISISDQERLKNTLDKSLISASKDDLASVFYFSKGYSLLNKPASSELIKNACDRLSNSWSASSSLENTFFIVASWNQLKCPGKLSTKEIVDVSLLNFSKCTIKIKLI